MAQTFLSFSHGVCARDNVKTRLTERMRTTLMWMSVEVVASVRIVQCHALKDFVIHLRFMECHASLDVVIGVHVVLCHQVIDFPLQNFPLRVQILNLLSCCSISS